MEAAGADGDPSVPIYISSDEEEEDGHANAYVISSDEEDGHANAYVISSDEEDGHANAYVISSDEEDGHAPESYSPEEIEIQEAILLSLDPSRAPAATASSSAFPSTSRPTGVSNPRETPADRKGKRQVSSQDGSSNNMRKKCRFNCAICFEMVDVSEKFAVSHCAHAFCNSCIGRYVAGKITENVAVVGCPDPGCEEGVVEMDLCRDIVPPELFDRWNVALCENLLGDDKLYCPFKDCSALLVDDGSVEIRETECPHCHRPFCARCMVPWHDGVGCEEFQELGEDERSREDLMLRRLAGEKRWQRCPKCRMYVEKSEGCMFMRCRCGYCFCYSCGSPMSKEHYCRKCLR